MRTIIFFLLLLFYQAGNAQNIGIGVTTPATPLHIKATGLSQLLRLEGANPYISFFNGSTYSGYLWYNADKMELGTPSGSGEPVLIAPGRINTAYFTTAGRVGIGTAVPSEKLDVAGNINLTGLLKINGVGGTTGQVLTSKGASDPVWENAAFGNTTRFCFTMLETGISGLVDFNTTRYNLNTTDVIRNPSSITITRTGLYHFDFNLHFFLDYDGAITVPPSVYLEMSIDGALYHILQGATIPEEHNTFGDDFRLAYLFSIDLYIAAPATITLPYDVYYSGTPVGRSIYGQLAGYLISE